MQIFNICQSDLLHLNGQKIIGVRPLDQSEYDLAEVGEMWLIRLDSGGGGAMF